MSENRGLIDTLGEIFMTGFVWLMVLGFIIMLLEYVEDVFQNKSDFEDCKNACNLALDKDKDKPKWRLCREDCRLDTTMSENGGLS